GALHVVVAAEDIGATARYTDVAQRQLQDAVGTHVVVADMVLRAAHAPDQGAGPVFGHGLGNLVHFFPGDAGHVVHHLGRPLPDLLPHVLHAVDALADVLLVFPAVLEDVPQYPPDQRHVGAGAKAHVLIGMRGSAGEARIGHDHDGAVLLAAQDMLHRHRVRLGCVAADEKH